MMKQQEPTERDIKASREGPNSILLQSVEKKITPEGCNMTIAIMTFTN